MKKRYQQQPKTLGDITYLLRCLNADSKFVRYEAQKVLSAQAIFTVEDEETRVYLNEYTSDSQRMVQVKIVGGHYEGVPGDNKPAGRPSVNWDEREVLEREGEAVQTELADWRRAHLADSWRSSDEKHFIEIWCYEDGFQGEIDGNSPLGPMLPMVDLTEEQQKRQPGIVARIGKVGLTLERRETVLAAMKRLEEERNA